MEKVKVFIKEFNINLNNNRALYEKLIQVCDRSQMMEYLVEDCNVDKTYILQCLKTNWAHTIQTMRKLMKSVILFAPPQTLWDVSGLIELDIDFVQTG